MIASPAPWLWIAFISDEIVNDRGFQLEYRFTGKNSVFVKDWCPRIALKGGTTLKGAVNGPCGFTINFTLNTSLRLVSVYSTFRLCWSYRFSLSNLEMNLEINSPNQKAFGKGTHKKTWPTFSLKSIYIIQFTFTGHEVSDMNTCQHYCQNVQVFHMEWFTHWLGHSYTYCFEESVKVLARSLPMQKCLQTYREQWEKRLRTLVVTQCVHSQLNNLLLIHSECGGTLTAPDGSLSSPNYPSDYPHDVSCSWLISAPEGYQITVSLTLFLWPYGLKRTSTVCYSYG